MGRGSAVEGAAIPPHVMLGRTRSREAPGQVSALIVYAVLPSACQPGWQL